MNKLSLGLACLVGSVCYIAAQTTASSPAEEPSGTAVSAAAAKDIYPLWSVVGEWQVTHPYWSDTLTLRADGSASTSEQGTTARWMLTADGGTPLLVLRWDAFGTESLSMVGPNHFRGQIVSGSFMDMRRGEVGSK